MDKALLERINDCSTLPTVPAVALEVIELAKKNDCRLIELGEAVGKDPALSGKILKTVNSSFYGRGQRVTTLDQAIVVLGLQSVRTVTLGFALVDKLRETERGGFDHSRYWRHSFYTACAARMLAQRAGLLQAEEMFVCGLLSNIGMLLLSATLGEDYDALCSEVANHHEQAGREAELLGSDHAEVGGHILASWKLPPVLHEPVRWHVHPEQAADETLREMAQMLNLAEQCGAVFADSEPAQAIACVRQLFDERFPDDVQGADDLLGAVGKAAQEFARAFELNIGPDIKFEKILREANEALIELSLQSQQAAADARLQAAEMQSRMSACEEALRKEATTDVLTGLANRRKLDEFLAEELAGACAGGQPLAVVMIDIDRFKSVNDANGHAAGDAVLRFLGHLLRENVEKTDLAARYGGEEFVLVLPGADRATATAMAEHLRQNLSSTAIDCGGGMRLQVTASFGIAAYEPRGPLAQPELLMKAADRALYHAKESGRNRVRVFSLASNAPAAA